MALMDYLSRSVAAPLLATADIGTMVGNGLTGGLGHYLNPQGVEDAAARTGTPGQVAQFAGALAPAGMVTRGIGLLPQAVTQAPKVIGALGAGLRAMTGAASAGGAFARIGGGVGTGLLAARLGTGSSPDQGPSGGNAAGPASAAAGKAAPAAASNQPDPNAGLTPAQIAHNQRLDSTKAYMKNLSMPQLQQFLATAQASRMGIRPLMPHDQLVLQTAQAINEQYQNDLTAAGNDPAAQARAAASRVQRMIAVSQPQGFPFFQSTEQGQ